MNRGVLLFAFNNQKFNYLAMALATARRIEHFLELPVSVVTDKESLPVDQSALSQFDEIILVEPDKNNRRDHAVWINKGRYQAYDLSPYHETILLDTDYMVNSDTLLKTFDIYDDFCCHRETSFLMHPSLPQEMLSSYSFQTLWATVITFKKTPRAKQIFDCLKMIQNNYGHYANIHNFIPAVFRNDYALTLALRIVNGHVDTKQDFIPWNLVHVGIDTEVLKNSADEFDTSFTLVRDNHQRGKVRKEYLTICDTDFHCIDKVNYIKLIK